MKNKVILSFLIPEETLPDWKFAAQRKYVCTPHQLAPKQLYSSIQEWNVRQS